MRFRHLVLAAILALAAFTSDAHASLNFNLYISSQNQGFFYASSTVFLTPADFAVPFTTGRISTPDNQHVVNYEGFWRPQYPLLTFNSASALINSINQPWQIVLDEGLPTERHYTTSLNVTGLQSTDISAPQITFPASQSVVDTLTPTFTFTNLNNGAAMRLEYLNNGQGSIVASQSLAGPASSWSPQTPLVAGEYYLNILRYMTVSDLSFSAPVDELGNAIPNWHSNSTVQLESSHWFTVVPEPSSLSLLATSALLFLASKKTRRFSRSSGMR
jgi:hypothetical protein